MKLPLTPGQAVTIHGWVRPRSWLTWADVLVDPRLTYAFLTGTCALTEYNLHLMQPDVSAWVKAGRVTLEDTPRLTLWGAHPIRDLHADLADLIRMGWTAETMSKLGLTYEDMVGVGLIGDNMALFSAITLMGWHTLGFRREHAEAIHPATLYRLFGLTREQILAALP